MGEEIAVAQVETKALSEWEWETPKGNVKLSVDIVRRYFCPKATEPEIYHFMAVCKYHRLNPWLREAYLIKYEDGKEASIVMGKWAHARKAEEHPQYAGTEGGIIVQMPDGSVDRREGTFFLEPEKLVGGWAKVYRADRERPELREVRLNDWFRVGPYWKSSPAHMINKVAVSQARHEAFPGEYTDLISEEELRADKGAITIDMQPLSIQESQEKAEQGQEAEGSKKDLELVSGDEAKDAAGMDAALEAEAHAREQAEAEQEKPKPPTTKVDRGMVWTELLRRAKKENKTAGKLLVELVQRQVSGLAECEEGELVKVAKALGIVK